MGASVVAALLAHDAPARGTPLSDLVPATIVAIVAVIALAIASVAHRRGRFHGLERAGTVSERTSGFPGWAGVPIAVTTTSLVIAVFGFYWDVSWHIDRGRDPGPFANPAHWFIIVGLAGIALAGILAIVMGDDVPTSTSVHLGEGWEAPVGGILLAVCGGIALLGFPLDDIWHRIFGQDVTLWGPTHIQMVGGASLATLAMWVLMVEGLRRQGPIASARMRWFVDHQDVFIGGAFLLGLSTLQGEFDYGVPQFRQVYHPVLIMLAASIGLVAVRLRAGRGSAVGASVFFVATRGALALVIGPVLGRSTLHFPLYLAEAVLVELVVWRVGERRPITVGLWSGVAIGTVGLAAEWAWSHVWMPLPWPSALFPAGAFLALVAAIAGGVIGGLAGRALGATPAPSQPTPRFAAGLAAVAALAVIAICLPIGAPKNVRADVQVAAPNGGTGPWATVTVRLHPAGAAEHANWFDVIAWQGERTGRGGLILADLRRQPDGSYRTDRLVPTHGTWKTMIRLHRGNALGSLPVYLPADDAIPVKGVTPAPAFTGTFLRDKTVLQREAVGGSNALQRAAYAALGLLALAWIGSLAWGLRRLERGAAGRPVVDGAIPSVDTRQPGVVGSR